MSKTIFQKIVFSTLLISIFLTFSCSNQTESLDKKYLDKVQTLDSTVKAYYDAFSADKKGIFDWDLLKFLFLPEGKLIRYGPGKDRNYSIIYYSTDDYIERYKKYMENVGFYEKEIYRKVTIFGNISHVLSAYECFEKFDDKPIIRGINSLQLLNDGKRWWIVNAYWTRETPNNPILEEYFLKE
jgi:hypothetical protein